MKIKVEVGEEVKEREEVVLEEDWMSYEVGGEEWEEEVPNHDPELLLTALALNEGHKGQQRHCPSIGRTAPCWSALEQRHCDRPRPPLLPNSASLWPLCVQLVPGQSRLGPPGQGEVQEEEEEE